MKKFNTNYDFEKSHIYLNSVNKYLLDEVNNGNLNAFVTLTSNKQMKIDDFLLTLNNCFEQTRNQINKSIKSYNELRPHASCDYFTPNQAHLQSDKLNKRWKNYNKSFYHEKRIV